MRKPEHMDCPFRESYSQTYRHMAGYVSEETQLDYPLTPDSLCNCDTRKKVSCKATVHKCACVGPFTQFLEAKPCKALVHPCVCHLPNRTCLATKHTSAFCICGFGIDGSSLCTFTTYVDCAPPELKPQNPIILESKPFDE
jgi:hypothetical protein